MNKRLKDLAVQAGLEELDDGDWSSLDWTDVYPEDLERFAELVRQDEREECAKLCDGIDTPDGWSTASLCASIRARGNE